MHYVFLLKLPLLVVKTLIEVRADSLGTLQMLLIAETVGSVCSAEHTTKDFCSFHVSNFPQILKLYPQILRLTKVFFFSQTKH